MYVWAKSHKTRATRRRPHSKPVEAVRADDGVPAVGPDEGPGSKTRAEAAVWGHGEPRRESQHPISRGRLGGQANSHVTDQPVHNPTQDPKSTILKLGP